MESPSLQEFKIHVDVALRGMVSGDLGIAEGILLSHALCNLLPHICTLGDPTTAFLGRKEKFLFPCSFLGSGRIRMKGIRWGN